jgi:exodeoxyribonuclease VII small subunit
MDSKSEPAATGTDGQQEQTFDEILNRLQGIVERLEGGELALEDSLRAFEQGIALSRKGQAILDAAEQRVEVLLQEGETAPFEPEAGS